MEEDDFDKEIKKNRFNSKHVNFINDVKNIFIFFYKEFQATSMSKNNSKDQDPSCESRCISIV